MRFSKVAVAWGMKEESYNHPPFLPSIGCYIPTQRDELEKLVAAIHSQHGSEASFYWCFPFWVLAAQLQSLGASLGGISEFTSRSIAPDLIILVDLPVKKSDFHELLSTHKHVPIILLVAETPLERHAQHCIANLKQFAHILTYSRLLTCSAQISHYRLPFRFHRPPNLSLLRTKPPSKRSYFCAYVGNAHSSGWRRNFQYHLGWSGWPVIWQYLQGWKIPFSAIFRDEYYGAYTVRQSLVLASFAAYGPTFFLCGRNWSNGGSGWLSRLLPDRRLKIRSSPLGMFPGSKVTSLCDSTFTIACENYLGNSGYISEKIFDSMSAGSIPIYIGAPGSLPIELKDCVIDLSDFPRRKITSVAFLTSIFKDLLSMPESELNRRQKMCLNYIDSFHEMSYGVDVFVSSILSVLDNT